MNNKSKLPIIMVGGGGHASVLTEILLSQGREILLVLSPEKPSQKIVYEGIKISKNDNDILKYQKSNVLLVNGIGMQPNSNLRQKVNEYFISLGFKFETVVDKSALISPSSKIEDGVQILPMSIIQTGVTIGKDSIINTGALIEHDCKIGAYNHIAPRATLCGNISTGNGVFIGANATVIQSVNIGENVVIGAGAIVKKDLEPMSKHNST